MRIGKQPWQKVVSLLKTFATPRSKELERELSAVRREYRELGLRASTLAGEGNMARKSLEKAKQQIDSVHGELGAAYKAREQLTIELQQQLESLKAEQNQVQSQHNQLVARLAGYDRQLETLEAASDAHRLREQELLADIKSLEQRTSEAEQNDLTAKDHNQTLAVELAGIQYEFETSKDSKRKQLADLELKLGDIEAERSSTREQLQSLEDSLTQVTTRHGDTQQQVKALEGKLEAERKRHQANLNTVEEKLTRVQIEQESLINVQSGLTDALRKNRRWATVAVGIAFLTGVLVGITKIQNVQNDVPEQAAVTDDLKPSLEPQVSRQNKPPREEPLSQTGEAVESAAFETETAPIDKTEPTTGEPQSNKQAGQIDKLDLPREGDAGAPIKPPLTPSQAMAAMQAFESKVFFEKNARKEGVISLPSGLQYKVLRAGGGKSPRPTDRVILHYRGRLPDGREFDSSYAKKAPAAYRVDQVIAGWREALQRMQEGAQWELYIPPELAHSAGTQGTPGFLPLIYQIELISVSKTNASQLP